MATIGDAFFSVHQWTFTYLILSTSVTIPIAMKALNGDMVETNKEEKRAKRIKIATSIGFYGMLTVWFIGSVWTGSSVWRFSNSLVYMYIMTVFIVSLLLIRRFLNQIENKKDKINPNNALMNLNLAIFAFEWFAYCTKFILAMESSDTIEDATDAECREIIGFHISYWLNWIGHIAGTVVTSYMNIMFTNGLV